MRNRRRAQVQAGHVVKQGEGTGKAVLSRQREEQVEGSCAAGTERTSWNARNSTACVREKIAGIA